MSKKCYLGVDDINPIYDEDILMGVQVTFHGSTSYFPCDKYEVFIPEDCRKQAHDEAWEFAKNICEMSTDDRNECFEEVFFASYI